MASFQRKMANKPQGATDKSDHNLDAVVIGAGFSGIYLFHRLRKEGFNVKLIEAGNAIGGVWHWNNYPGARVDSQYPVYALSIPEVYDTWQWTETYPGAPELQRYFKHVDNVLNISKDTLYNTRVNSAVWNESDNTWKIQCDNGTSITTRFMHCCLGFAAKRHFPDWKGLEEYKGYICHSSFWPVEGVDMKGKRVAVIGNGATGIQIAQEAARDASQLGVYIRTPNTTIPMQQRPVDPVQAKKDLATIGDKLERLRFENAGGFLFTGQNKKCFEDPPEVREKVLHDALDYGGFSVLFQYNDLLTDEEANQYIYSVVNKRNRARMTNAAKRDLLAPEIPPHPFMGKRPSLEQDYYEQMDKDHVEIIPIKQNPVDHVTETGIVTADGKLHEYDIIAIATGFDSITGGFMEIDITGVDGESLQKKWNGPKGAWTYLGMAVAKFPNMLFTYGPQAPTAYGNGPSIVEPQAEFIVDVMKRMKAEGKTKIDAKEKAEQDWKELVNTMHEKTLRHNVDSWYMGTNIPGKPRQVLNYAGTLPMYMKTIREVLDKNYEGFTVT